MHLKRGAIRIARIVSDPFFPILVHLLAQCASNSIWGTKDSTSAQESSFGTKNSRLGAEIDFRHQDFDLGCPKFDFLDKM